jgi:hypothetical protein
MAAKLARLRAAQDTLAGRQAAPASPDARVAAARDALAKVEQRLARAGQAQAATMEKYQAEVPAGKDRGGRKPVPADRNVRIARIRTNVATARDRLAAAQAHAAAAAPVKVSATDPGTRVLPAKNGGWTQGWNLQLAAARRQVLLAIELHDNPADCGALVTLVQAAAANCELAGLREQIRAWLADNGYASAANFTALEHLLLLVAVTGEATQAGRASGGRALPAGWEHMAARLATPAGKTLYKRRAAQAEPGLRPVLRPVRPLPQLPRPRRRRRRDQAAGRRAQHRQAAQPPAPSPGTRPRLRHTAQPPAVPARRDGAPACRPHPGRPPGPAGTPARPAPPATALPRGYNRPRRPPSTIQTGHQPPRQAVALQAQ